MTEDSSTPTNEQLQNHSFALPPAEWGTADGGPERTTGPIPADAECRRPGLLDISSIIPTYVYLKEYVLFYPTNLDKSPATRRRKLSRVATTDPSRIQYLSNSQRSPGFGAQILDSRLLVLDVDTKHWRCDGYVQLVDLLDKHNIRLPKCPTVRTPSGGFHLYLLIPQGFTITGGIAVWPGIDILTKGRNVIQPGSRTFNGEYTIERSFEDHPIPECPIEFIELILSRQQQTRASKAQANVQNTEPAPRSSPGLSSREWCRLKRNKVFRAMWDRKAKSGDQSPSAREYHIAKAVLCQGLSVDQTYGVIAAWRTKYNYWNYEGTLRSRKQIRAIVKGAWREVAPYVEGWHTEQELKAQAKRAASTEGLICSALTAQGPQTPKSIAAILGVPHERVKKAMLRLHNDEKLERISRGVYRLKTHSSSQGTNCCITTSPLCILQEELEPPVEHELLIKNSVKPAADGHLTDRSCYRKAA